MPNLLPEGYENEAVTAAELINSSVVGYKPGVYFSHEAGGFPRDGKNRIMDATGIESWEIWCKNCLLTERYKHLAYSTDFGIQIEPAFKAETRAKAESILIREISEALEADPYGRTEYVSDIKFDWSIPDAVTADVTVKGINDVTIDITAILMRNR